MKRCLAFLQAPEQAAAVLGLTAHLVPNLGLKAVDVAGVRSPPEVGTAPLTPEAAFLYEEQQRSHIAALHARFCLWLQTEYQHDQAQVEATAVTWEETDGAAAESLPRKAQGVDLIITSMVPASAPEAERLGLDAVVRHAPCPVLLVPLGWDKPCGKSVLVAWAEGAAVQKLVEAVSPFIDKAQHVSSLAAVGENLPARLEGATVTRLPLPLSEHNAADVVALEAQKRRADLIVFAPDPQDAEQSTKVTFLAGMMARAKAPLLLYGAGQMREPPL